MKRWVATLAAVALAIGSSMFGLRCAESPSHRTSDRQKGLLGLISQDKLRPALRATLRHADLETSSAQAARWYSLISPWRRC